MAIICGVWFCLHSWCWTFLINLVVAFPIGFLGLYAWGKARQINPNDKRNAAAIALLGLGLANSIVALFLYR